MDDDLQQLENELRSLRPAGSTRELLARLELDLMPAAARSPARDFRWFWAAALPAAAALAISWVAFFPRSQSGPAFSANVPLARKPESPEPAVSETQLKPITAENVLVATSDEGLVTLGDGTPARRERRQYVDTITWKNPRTNASLTWSVPREEVRVVPIAFQ